MRAAAHPAPAGLFAQDQRAALFTPSTLFLAAVIVLFVRLLAVPEPMLMNDEYYYIKTAQLWWDGTIDSRAITNIPNRGEAGFPNSLFFAIYQFSFFFGDQFYAAAKFLNLLFAALAALAVSSVAGHFMDRMSAMWIAVLSMWMPSTSFLPYFMPEALYECLTWWGLAALFALYERRFAMGAALLGMFLGAAMLAKPNALAVLAGCNLVLLCAVWRDADGGSRIRKAVVGLLLLNLCFVLAAYLINLLLTGHVRWDPLGKFYQHGLSKLTEVPPDRSYAQAVARYFFAYLFVIVLIFGPALVALGAGLLRARLNARDVLLAAATVLGVGVLLAGSVKVGVDWERVYPNHTGIFSTRYMSALFPLFFIAFVRFLPNAVPNRRARAWTGAAVLLVAVLLMGVRSYVDNWTQMREAFWPRGLHEHGFKLVCGVLVATTAYYAFARAPRARVYAAVMVLWAFGAASVFLRTDFLDARNGVAHQNAESARTVASLLDPSSYDQGHLVASGVASQGSRFMSRFPGIISFDVVPADSPEVARQRIPASARWVVFLAGARPGFDANCMHLKNAELCVLDSSALRKAP